MTFAICSHISDSTPPRSTLFRYDLDDQPILFFYIHFIHFLSALYLPLLALFVAHQVGSYGHWMSDLVGFMAVVFQAIFVIGIRVLAQIMQHPYGGELENLSVLTYIEVAIQGSMRVLSSQKRSPLNPIVENRLAAKRDTLGEAWEDLDTISASRSTSDTSDDDTLSCMSCSRHENDERLSVGIDVC